MIGQIHFILNDRTVCTSQPPGVTVLDYLRQKARLTGTKEGCSEGGCGACTVLLGELQEDRVYYRAVVSCLLPLGELAGKHLVTIEGLNQSKLSLVQQAFVDYGATQCGFCTPGMVMSLTGYLLSRGTEISEEGFKNALSGNLCRCTGYASIKRAYQSLIESLGKNSQVTIQDGIFPKYFLNIPERLRSLPKPAFDNEESKSDFIVAGGTDLYVEHGDILPESQVRLLNQSSLSKEISSSDGEIRIGALTTFAELASHPAILKIIPDISAYIKRIASYQIRNRATIGGNLVAASPIGDGSILLLALDSRLVLKKGNKSRTVAIKQFFHGYKETAIASGEILTEIIIPLFPPTTKINFEKVSKRQYLDCAVVNSVMRVLCQSKRISAIAISMGGVAPIPLLLQKTSKYFMGKEVTQETIEGAFPILQAEISPISDIHGSARYKRLSVRQLLIAHLTKLFPESVTVRDFYETN
ncbi:MAG: FAD binding domain-containing protein [Xenococcus sp. MO_188.B8]|nr:FAD binding domain-containing protein [Xenococcus sp. MO_188.B8]